MPSLQGIRNLSEDSTNQTYEITIASVHQPFHLIPACGLTDTAFFQVSKYIRMTESNEMAFPHSLVIRPTLECDIVDHLLPSHKLLPLDIRGNGSTYPATDSLFTFLSLLTKQHFFLASLKCGYVPRLKFRFSAFFILIILRD